MEESLATLEQILQCDTAEAKRLLRECNGDVNLAVEIALDRASGDARPTGAWGRTAPALAPPPGVRILQHPPKAAPVPPTPMEPVDPVVAQLADITGCAIEEAARLMADHGNLEAALRAYTMGSGVVASNFAPPPSLEDRWAEQSTDVEVGMVYVTERNWHNMRPEERETCLSVVQ
eukprot:2360557-Amphidinium_carterae.1